jgi:hypothetical protein
VIAVGGGFLDAGDAVDVEHAVEDSTLLGGRVAVVEEAAALEREPILGPLLAVLLHQPAALAVQNLLGGKLDGQLDGLVAAAGGGFFHAAIAVRVAVSSRASELTSSIKFHIFVFLSFQFVVCLHCGTFKSQNNYPISPSRLKLTSGIVEFGLLGCRELTVSLASHCCVRTNALKLI